MHRSTSIQQCYENIKTYQLILVKDPNSFYQNSKETFNETVELNLHSDFLFKYLESTLLSKLLQSKSSKLPV